MDFGTDSQPQILFDPVEEAQFCVQDAAVQSAFASYWYMYLKSKASHQNHTMDI